MLSIIGLIIFLGLVVSSVFYRVKTRYWFPALLLYTILLGFMHASLILLLPLSLLCLIAIAAMLPFLRRRYVTQLVLNYVARVLPKMTETERIAIEAGDVWWEGELFQGKPNWNHFLSQPLAVLTEEENAFLAGPVEELCRMIQTWDIQTERKVPDHILNYLKQARFFGMMIEKTYGGLGFSAWAHSCVITKIGSRSIDVAVTAMVPNSLGPAELLQRYGTASQKDHYLPRLASGQEIPCFGLTSLDAGSDANAMQDHGIVCRGLHEGQEVLGIRLNFKKRYITLAPIATLISVAFRLSDPEHLLGQSEQLGITLALIPTHHPGVKAGERHWPMYLNFMNGPCSGEDVFIPLNWVIGERDGVGQGWRMLMECLSIGRSISLPALSAANGKMSYRLSGIYAHLRQQFNLSIGAFEGVQSVLGKIAGYSYGIEALRIVTASAVAQGVNPSIVSAITKYQTTEWGRMVLNAAMDVHGGRTVQVGPRNYLAQAYLGIPVSITVEGANILTRNLIIFGQGAMRAHPYLQQEIACAQSEQPDRLKKFDRLFWKHVGYALRNLIHTRIYGATCGRWIKAPKSSLKPYYQKLTRMSAALAILSDVTLLMLGGSLKRKENLSARLGDVLTGLYTGSAILKMYEASTQSEEERLHAEWTLKVTLYNIQESLYDFCANFPIRALGWVLIHIIFPFGRAYSPPLDQHTQKLAEIMQKPSIFRDEFARYTFLSHDISDATGRMEAAWDAVLAAEEAEKKLHQHVKSGRVSRRVTRVEQIEEALKQGLLTVEEIAILKKALHACAEALEVDIFSHEGNKL